jgi:SRSO17 transposase
LLRNPSGPWETRPKLDPCNNAAEDGARRRAAGIPDEIEFATKPMLGKRMLERAFQAGMPCGWVAGDEVYGHDSKLRRWLEEHQQPYEATIREYIRTQEQENQRLDQMNLWR